MEEKIILVLSDIENQLVDIKIHLEENNKTTFYGIKDVMSVLNWSEVTVQNLFNRTDFPCTDYGKEKKILKSEFENYFKSKRIKS
ncbi:MAG: hypothetical protein RR489_06805 [Clostridia bacterium]